jgi:3-phytase
MSSHLPIKRTLAAMLAASLTAACTTPAIWGGLAVQITASGETAPVGTSDADAADDPAIWRNDANPSASLIVATDKKAGLYVYGMDGAIRSFSASGLLNNVDLVDMGGDTGIIVAASDRTDETQAAIRLFRLDPTSAKLTELGSVAVGAGEAYGLCALRDGNAIRIASIIKDGRIDERLITISGNVIAPQTVTLPPRRVATQPEGCVYDPRDKTLFVGEEMAGIWQFADGQSEGTLVAPIDNRALVADVEGLAIDPIGTDGGWLIASSQGDNAYAVYALPKMEFAGRFRIAAGTYGATEETDGIALAQGSFGPDYPGGLFIAQDGQNAPDAQNFKLVDWGAIRSALGLED